MEVYIATFYEFPKTKSKFPEFERILNSWFLEQRYLKNIVTNEILKLKAKEIHVKMSSREKFVGSDGWLNNFTKRHGIHILTISGEKISCNTSKDCAEK